LSRIAVWPDRAGESASGAEFWIPTDASERVCLPDVWHVGELRLLALGDASPMHSPEPDARGEFPSSLAALDQRTVAVQLTVSGAEKTLLGRGHYERDEELGNLLRIEFPPEVDCEFLIVEDRWQGRIAPGQSLACDFLIRLDKQ